MAKPEPEYEHWYKPAGRLWVCTKCGSLVTERDDHTLFHANIVTYD